MDTELHLALSEAAPDFVVPHTSTDIGLLRRSMRQREATDEEIRDAGYATSTLLELAHGSGVPVQMLSLRPVIADEDRPSVLYLHGGGGVAGSERNGLAAALRWTGALGLPVFALRYRLAPEHPLPAAVDDVLLALEHLVNHEEAPPPILLGVSGGGAVAALASLRARGSKVAPRAQMLLFPMLDYDELVSPPPVPRGGEELWDRYASRMAWRALLGRDRSTGAIERLVPSAHQDLAALPPTYVDVAGFDVLHDEGVTYADRLRAHGTDVTVQEWPDAYHCFDQVAPNAHLSVLAREARQRWVASSLGVAPAAPNHAAHQGS